MSYFIAYFSTVETDRISVSASAPNVALLTVSAYFRLRPKVLSTYGWLPKARSFNCCSLYVDSRILQMLPGSNAIKESADWNTVPRKILTSITIKTHGSQANDGMFTLSSSVSEEIDV